MTATETVSATSELKTALLTSFEDKRIMSMDYIQLRELIDKFEEKVKAKPLRPRGLSVEFWRVTKEGLVQIKDLAIVELCRTKVRGISTYAKDVPMNEIHAGNELKLIREPGNPKDGNVIGVYWNMHKIGFVSKERADVIAPLMDDKLFRVKVSVLMITGGPTQNWNYGLNFKVEVIQMQPNVRICPDGLEQFRKREGGGAELADLIIIKGSLAEGGIA